MLQVFRGANVKKAGKSRTKEPDGKSLYKHMSVEKNRDTCVKNDFLKKCMMHLNEGTAKERCFV